MEGGNGGEVVIRGRLLDTLGCRWTLAGVLVAVKVVQIGARNIGNGLRED